MSRTLRIYIIREVATPTLLALLTVTFILLISQIYNLIRLLLQPGVHFWQVMQILGSLIPWILVLAAPMSLLIGVLVGVGRLTLDREILAVRANGINLLSVFAPTILLALAVSITLMALSASVIPRLLLGGMTRISELKMAVITTLEPGLFHDKLPGMKEDGAVYFRERDPATQAMKGLVIKQETSFKQPKARAKGARGAPAAATAAETSITAQAATPHAGHDRIRDTQITMIFAETGQVESKDADAIPGDEGGEKTAIVLNMSNGSIHRLSPDPADNRYVATRFKKGTAVLLENKTIAKVNKTRTTAELRELNAGFRKLGPTPKEFRRPFGAVREELYERVTFPLAAMVFVLVAIPLAIRLRPTGKSWGILLAIGLMLVYYVLMKMGLSMIQELRPLGVVMAFFPCVLFLVLGAGLWWHTLRT